MSRSSGSQSLYDVSFKLYRLSPLYCPSSVFLLLSETLLLHSRRFAEILEGDILRGVYVGLGESSEASSASGALKACRWTLLDPTAAFSDGAEDQRSALPGLEGIKVEAHYEKTTYTALLVRKLDSANSRAAGPTNLPLLMTRMPPALRETLIAYIGTTFDTRIEPMRLSSVFMGDMLEIYLEGILQAGNEYFEKMMKGIQLVLGFRKEVVPDLKSFSIDIRKEEVMGFIKKGRALLTQSPLGDTASKRASENGEVGKHPKRPSPFMAAMKRYITEQTSLNLEHRDVYLSRLSCGGFVLTADGSVRFLVPPSLVLKEDGLPQSQTPQSTITSIVEAILAEASARPAQLNAVNRLPDVLGVKDARHVAAGAANTVLEMPYTTSDPTIATAIREQLGAFILQAANAFPNLDTLSISYRFGVAVGHAMLKSLNTKPGEPGFSQNFYRPTLSEYKFFNQILRKVAWERKKGDATSGKTNDDLVRVFALANVALGDAGISAWLEKWCLEFWRPLTGVREGRGSRRDPFWLTCASPITNKPTGALAYVMSFVEIWSAFSNTVPINGPRGSHLYC